MILPAAHLIAMDVLVKLPRYPGSYGANESDISPGLYAVHARYTQGTVTRAKETKWGRGSEV